MRTSFFIALRYLFSKKSRNIINVISFISLFGIAVATAAMVIVLSAFNGIENMVIGLYSDFDQDITIHLAKGKTMNETFFPYEKLEQIEGVVNKSRVIEEVVIIKNEDKWANAKIFGVDSTFLSMSSMQSKILDSATARIDDRGQNLAVLGAGLFDKLEVYLSYDIGDYDKVSIHAPFRKAKSARSSNAFSKAEIGVSSRFNFNKDVNDKYAVVPLEFARDLLHYENDITFIALKFLPETDLEDKKQEIQNLLGADYLVKTRYEKNEIIYKTNKIERILAIVILCFIFLLATFNMIASLSMLFLEKEKDLITLKSMGADKKMVFRIFFLEGMLINVFGMLLGLLLGALVSWVQMKFQFIAINENGQEIFPIILRAKDFLLISVLILVLGAISCWAPVKILLNRAKVF